MIHYRCTTRSRFVLPIWVTTCRPFSVQLQWNWHRSK